MSHLFSQHALSLATYKIIVLLGLGRGRRVGERIGGKGVSPAYFGAEYSGCYTGIILRGKACKPGGLPGAGSERGFD